MDLISPVIDITSKIIDKLFPDHTKAEEAKLKLLEMQQTGELLALIQQSKVVVSEEQGESWLQRNWRPITMLTFVALVVANWLGYTAPGISEATELELMELIKIGLGGYVIGRSVEKAIKTWKEK